MIKNTKNPPPNIIINAVIIKAMIIPIPNGIGNTIDRNIIITINIINVDNIATANGITVLSNHPNTRTPNMSFQDLTNKIKV